MKNLWLGRKMHKQLLMELMAAQTDETTLGDFIECLPQYLKDYFLECRIFFVESSQEEQVFDISIEHFDEFSI